MASAVKPLTLHISCSMFFSLQAAGLQRPHVRREITEYASGKKSSTVMAEFESWAAFNMALKQFH